MGERYFFKKILGSDKNFFFGIGHVFQFKAITVVTWLAKDGWASYNKKIQYNIELDV